MIYFVTVHFQSDRWIDIQLGQIAKHTSEEHQVWASLNEIDARHRDRFEVAEDLPGTHPEKLNAIASRISQTAADDDLLVFIDGDAFPIDDFVPPIRGLLKNYPLVAIRRSENLGDPHPHPCFAVTTVGFWNELGGDWTVGGSLARGERPPFTWVTTTGRERADVGAQVMGELERRGIAWYPLRRTNRRNLHPVMFGVYADLVYHHGAGFRHARTLTDDYLSGSHRWKHGVMGRIAAERLKKRERRNLRTSESVYREILRDPGYVKRFFLEPQNDRFVAANG